MNNFKQLIMKEFKVGQRVKQYDNDIDGWAYGVITEVGDWAILVNWDDIQEDCEHHKNEWDSIIII